MTDADVRELIGLMPTFFRNLLSREGIDERVALAMTTKFRDAGRRSAPWKAYSQKLPGRPQDGQDGNRINRWLLEPTHKFYADERNATLVELKYYLQAFSFEGAPAVPQAGFATSFVWLTGHRVRPDEYLDPIQLISISMKDVVADPRMITSGHLIPLDRGGKHEPQNAFLILQRSNQLQGNLKIGELLTLADAIVTRHKNNGTFPALPEQAPKALIEKN